jgi:hypothetical protein
MWEICTKEKPWNFVTHSWQIAEKVGKGERLSLPPNNPLNALITKCWADSPDARPTFSEMYPHDDHHIIYSKDTKNWKKSNKL